MDPIELAIILLVLTLILVAAVLPVVALVVAIVSRKRLNAELARLQAASPLNSETLQQLRVSDLAPLATALQRLEDRVERIESALTIATPVVPKPEILPPLEQPPLEQQPEPSPSIELPVTDQTGPTTAPEPAPVSALPQKSASDLESIIGRRWVGWVAIGLILFATAFFLKYAFENRWIGELGRVAIGVAAGLSLTMLGFKYHRRGWRIFSQILTAGGIVLIYLSVYAAFGYYHLVTQKAAFVFLIILVAQAAGLALLYDARSIAVMALIGGFLAPILLRSDRDQYRTLFGYLAILDLSALALPKRWAGVNSLAFFSTHFMFWLWYGERYHPRKLGAVMIFQAGIFLIFLLAPIGRRLFRSERPIIEDLFLWPANAFVFFLTAFELLNPDYHDWMGVFSVGMALIYAGTAKFLLDRKATTEWEKSVMIGVALTFVTIAIPIQFKMNWITIAWSVQALVMMWVAVRIRSTRLMVPAYALFMLALGKLVLWDTHFHRAKFTPVLNKYFLSSLVVVGVLFVAAALHRRWKDGGRQVPEIANVVILMLAIATLWFIVSAETITYFRAQAMALTDHEEVRRQLWLGQMALSVLWSFYGAVLAIAGFIRRSAPVRWAALGLFALTVVKVMLVDIAGLRQLYRIVAFLVLGLILLLVAWGYNKAFRHKESLT